MNRKFFVAISLVLMITLAFSGCTSQEDTQKGLELTEFSYASEINGEDDYVSHSSTYGPNDIVYMYIEVDGFEFSDNTVDVTEDITVYGPDGDVFLEGTVVDQAFQTQGETEIWFNNQVTPSSEGFEAGEYEIEMDFTDNHANEDLTITRTFTIEE